MKKKPDPRVRSVYYWLKCCIDARFPKMVQEVLFVPFKSCRRGTQFSECSYLYVTKIIDPNNG